MILSHVPSADKGVVLGLLLIFSSFFSIPKAIFRAPLFPRPLTHYLYLSTSCLIATRLLENQVISPS